MKIIPSARFSPLLSTTGISLTGEKSNASCSYLQVASSLTENSNSLIKCRGRNFNVKELVYCEMSVELSFIGPDLDFSQVREKEQTNSNAEAGHTCSGQNKQFL